MICIDKDCTIVPLIGTIVSIPFQTTQQGCLSRKLHGATSVFYIKITFVALSNTFVQISNEPSISCTTAHSKPRAEHIKI